MNSSMWNSKFRITKTLTPRYIHYIIDFCDWSVIFSHVEYKYL